MLVVTLKISVFFVPSSFNSESIFNTIPLRFYLIIEQLLYLYRYHEEFVTNPSSHHIATIRFEDILINKSLPINQNAIGQ